MSARFLQLLPDHPHPVTHPLTCDVITRSPSDCCPIKNRPMFILFLSPLFFPLLEISVTQGWNAGHSELRCISKWRVIMGKDTFKVYTKLVIQCSSNFVTFSLLWKPPIYLSKINIYWGVKFTKPNSKELEILLQGQDLFNVQSACVSVSWAKKGEEEQIVVSCTHPSQSHC